jgi:hypothetical protein
MVGSGAGLVGGGLAAGVGHASTVRPDPSTLGVVGERGSHHEGRWPARFRLVPEVESALSGYGSPIGS